MTIYIFGNGNITFDEFIYLYIDPIRKYLVDANVTFLLCDFRGLDTLMMEYLKSETVNVCIYHIGERPRYFPDKFKTKANEWKLVGGFEDDSSRDLAAINECTHYLAVDKNSNDKRKSGTLKNIEICESLHKIKIG